MALFVNLITTAFLANFWQIFDYFELAPWVAMDFALIEMFWLLNEYESKLRVAAEECDPPDIGVMKMPDQAWAVLAPTDDQSENAVPQESAIVTWTEQCIIHDAARQGATQG